MDNNKKILLYLDQNILQYDFEDKLQVSKKPNIQWVYSDEHFREIKRKYDSRFFEVLAKIKARKLSVILDNNYQITDRATLMEYKDPKELYEKYIDTISPFIFTERIFNSIQTFFFGNKESLDPNEYIEFFKNTLDQLLKDALDGIDDIQLISQIKESIDVEIDDFERTLISAKEQIKPLNKLRKLMSKKQFSDLKEEDGSIVDQIWAHISAKANPITKDQMFGKEKLPYERKSDLDKYYPTYLAVVRCHSVLNFFGYWPDEGLAKHNKLEGINSDASHIAHSFFCSGIISSDIRLCKKAKAIYEYFGVPNNVYRLDI